MFQYLLRKYWMILLLFICHQQTAAQGAPPLPFDPIKMLPKSKIEAENTTERKIIEIKNADVLEQATDSVSLLIKRILRGNVRLFHEGASMTCDSALLFPDQNYLEAYNRVTIRKGDSLEIKSGLLKYFGDSKYALLEKNVQLKDPNSILLAPKMDYYVDTDIGNFYEGGKLISDSTVLTSVTGTYFQANKMAYFRDSVVLTHPDYTMYADSMRYDTRTKIAYFISATTIVSKEDTIFTSSGYFDTQNNKANFGSRPSVKKGQENSLKADNLDYDKAAGTGKATGNVVSSNSKDKVTILSDDMYYIDSINYVRATRNPLMIQEDSEDTLYLSADTLISFTKFIQDSSGIATDSFKIFYGYRQVKTIQGNMSGICDSIYFSGQDSIFKLFYNPILWMDSTQLLADTILMYMQDKKIVKIELLQNALIVQESDPGVYNQIKGRTIFGYLTDNKLRRVFVDGNAECIYFVQDDSSAYLGANQSQSATIEATFDEEDKIDRIKLNNQPEAIFTPIQLIDWGSFKLGGFIWRLSDKPIDKWDVIRDSVQYLSFVKETYPERMIAIDQATITPSMEPVIEQVNESIPVQQEIKQPENKPMPKPVIEDLPKIQKTVSPKKNDQVLPKE